MTAAGLAEERRRDGADDASWRWEEGVLPVDRHRGSGAAAVWPGRDGAVQMTRGSRCSAGAGYGGATCT